MLALYLEPLGASRFLGCLKNQVARYSLSLAQKGHSAEPAPINTLPTLERAVMERPRFVAGLRKDRASQIETEAEV